MSSVQENSVDVQNVMKNRLNKLQEVEAEEILQSSCAVVENRLLKKEVQKLYEILMLRRKKKPIPETTIIEDLNIEEEENIYDVIDFSKSNISTQTENHFDERKSFWRKSIRRTKKNKKTVKENQIQNEVKENDSFSRTNLRKTCAVTQSVSKKVTLIDNRRKSLAVGPIDDSYWDAIFNEEDVSTVSFREKINKFKNVFKSGLKLFKRQQVTEL